MTKIVDGVNIYQSAEHFKSKNENAAKVLAENLLVDDSSARLYGPFSDSMAKNAVLEITRNDDERDFLILKDRDSGEMYVLEGEEFYTTNSKKEDGVDDLNKFVADGKILTIDKLAFKIEEVINHYSGTERDLKGLGATVLTTFGGLFVGGAVGAAGGAAFGVSLTKLADQADDVFDSPNEQLKALTDASGERKMVKLDKPRADGFKIGGAKK